MATSARTSSSHGTDTARYPGTWGPAPSARSREAARRAARVQARRARGHLLGALLAGFALLVVMAAAGAIEGAQ